MTMATIMLLVLLGTVLVGLSQAAGGPPRPGPVAHLVHGLRELDRISRLHAASVDTVRRHAAR